MTCSGRLSHFPLREGASATDGTPAGCGGGGRPARRGSCPFPCTAFTCTVLTIGGGEDGAISIWEARSSAELLQRIETSDDGGGLKFHCAWCPCCSLVVSAQQGGIVAESGPAAGGLLCRSVSGNYAFACAYNRDGAVVAVSWDDGSPLTAHVRVWSGGCGAGGPRTLLHDLHVPVASETPLDPPLALIPEIVVLIRAVRGVGGIPQLRLCREGDATAPSKGAAVGINGPPSPEADAGGQGLTTFAFSPDGRALTGFSCHDSAEVWSGTPVFPQN